MKKARYTDKYIKWTLTHMDEVHASGIYDNGKSIDISMEVCLFHCLFPDVAYLEVGKGKLPEFPLAIAYNKEEQYIDEKNLEYE